MNTVTLRDAALELERAKNPKSNGIAVRRLLELLRNGTVQAGIFFPRATCWLPIPSPYWRDVTQKQFEAIKKPNGGDFWITIESIIDAYIGTLGESISVAQHQAAVSAAAKRCRVLLSHDAWQRYQKSDDYPRAARVPRGGRPPKEGWREVAIALAAQLLNGHGITPDKKRVDADATAMAILAGLKNANADLPSHATLKDAVGQVYHALAQMKAR